MDTYMCRPLPDTPRQRLFTTRSSFRTSSAPSHSVGSEAYITGSPSGIDYMGRRSTGSGQFVCRIIFKILEAALMVAATMFLCIGQAEIKETQVNSTELPTSRIGNALQEKLQETGNKKLKEFLPYVGAAVVAYTIITFLTLFSYMICQPVTRFVDAVLCVFGFFIVGTAAIALFIPTLFSVMTAPNFTFPYNGQLNIYRDMNISENIFFKNNAETGPDDKLDRASREENSGKFTNKDNMKENLRPGEGLKDKGIPDEQSYYLKGKIERSHEEKDSNTIAPEILVKSKNLLVDQPLALEDSVPQYKKVFSATRKRTGPNNSTAEHNSTTKTVNKLSDKKLGLDKMKHLGMTITSMMLSNGFCIIAATTMLLDVFKMGFCDEYY